MRATLSVAIPVETTANQLAAVASLLEAIGGARWEHLERSFGRMRGVGAVIAPPMAEVLEGLSRQLRREAAELQMAVEVVHE
jgi:hypothetical protein